MSIITNPETNQQQRPVVSMCIDDDDIDELMAEDLDAKSNVLWERGVREKLGDAEFERLYPARKEQ